MSDIELYFLRKHLEMAANEGNRVSKRLARHELRTVVKEYERRLAKEQGRAER